MTKNPNHHSAVAAELYELIKRKGIDDYTEAELAIDIAEWLEKFLLKHEISRIGIGRRG